MRKLCLLLIIALGPALIAFFYALLLEHDTAAYNTYANEYRKWPWRAGVSHLITTLPFHEEHSPPAWVQHDIDVGGNFPVHSASSRGIVSAKRYVPEQEGRAGYMVAIQEQDGLQYHVYYLHLAYPGAIPELDDYVFQGQLIGFSGETGCPGCGIHLHFGMSTGPYSGDNISIFPLAGFDSEEDIDLESYPSDNAGVGDGCGPPCDDTTVLDGTFYQSFTQAFQSYGAYDGIGVTWDPCGDGGCWWVHRWDSEPPFTGVLQDFDSPNPAFGHSAIMQGDGMSARWVFGDFWQKYISSCHGVQYFDYLGYPTSEQYEFDDGGSHFWRQEFQGGYIFKSNADNVVYVRDLNGEPFAASCGDSDSDEDGCTDAQEVPPGTGPKTPGANGGFNPYNHWDFFDVPVPANADPTPNGPKSQAIGMADVLAILFYVGTRDNDPPNANGVDYDSDKGVDANGDTIADIPPDGIEDGVDYDRSPGPQPNPPWDAGPPNGSVSFADVLVALAQVGLDCSWGDIEGPDGTDRAPLGSGGAMDSAPNGLAVDAIPGGGVDQWRVVTSRNPFDIDVVVTAAGEPYAGYDLALTYNDQILEFVPTVNSNGDTVPESWTYTGLGGMSLNATVAALDEDGDTALDRAAGGSARSSGSTSAMGPVVTGRFRCIGNGTSAVHLVSPGATTLGVGGATINTSLADASVSCWGVR